MAGILKRQLEVEKGLDTETDIHIGRISCEQESRDWGYEFIVKKFQRL